MHFASKLLQILVIFCVSLLTQSTRNRAEEFESMSRTMAADEMSIAVEESRRKAGMEREWGEPEKPRRSSKEGSRGTRSRDAGKPKKTKKRPLWKKLLGVRSKFQDINSKTVEAFYGA